MVYLVSCVSRKVGYPTQAQDLYISDWFHKARQYVFPHPWFILSAKYGLVPPTKIIAPYEATLIRMNKEERRRWAVRVEAAIKKAIPLVDKKCETLVFLAGDRYREFLVPALDSHGYRIEVPMELLPIGKQLQWLKEHTRGQSLF